jgi:hypothetical protein
VSIVAGLVVEVALEPPQQSTRSDVAAEKQHAGTPGADPRGQLETRTPARPDAAPMIGGASSKGNQYSNDGVQTKAGFYEWYKLPGHALLVGLCIWRLAGATKSYNVSFGNSDLKPLGIDRAAKSRALQALETAGLISLARRRGRFPTVTLPDARVYPRECSPRQVAG